MITLTGEIRKVLDHGYNDRNGNRVAQAKLIIEPPSGVQNYEVFLTAKQVASGLRTEWEKRIGSRASVVVSLYVNHEHQFYKFTATDGLPIIHKE